MTDPIPEMPPQPDPMPIADQQALQLSVGQLCSRLCEAVGIDPDTNRGFQLTVLEGDIPELTVYPVPPHDDTGPTDEWSGPLGEAMASTTHAVLPGTAAAPPVQMPPRLLPLGVALPDSVEIEAALVKVLRMMTDVLNGAGCDSETRAWLTEASHRLVDAMVSRVMDAAFGSNSPMGAAFANTALGDAAMVRENPTDG